MDKRIEIRSQGNILLVANYKSDVGYAWWLMENFWIQIAKYFKHRKKVLIYPRITNIPDHIKDSDIEIMEHDFSSNCVRSKRRLRDMILRKNIKSVYLTDKKYYDFRYLILRRWGVHKIVLHDHMPGERTPVPFYKRKLKAFIHSLKVFSCDHYIGVSRFVHQRLIKTACIPEGNCSYVLNGIRPIKKDTSYKHYANHLFDIPSDYIIVVSTGRATFYKGIDFIIKCADLLINRAGYRNVYFLHCGGGPDLHTFRNMLDEYRLNNRFILAGRRYDVRKILQSCHIAMHASHGEAFSLSILEYMSAGLSVLAPDNCGNHEAIENNVNGFLYPSGNAEYAVRILKNLIEDRHLRDSLGSRAMHTVKERLNLEKMNSEFVRIISRVL